MDYIGFLETCYELSGDAHSWLALVAERANPVFDQGYGTVTTVFRVTARHGVAHLVASFNCAYDAQPLLERMTLATPVPLMWQMLAGGRGTVSASEVAPRDFGPERFYASVGTPVPVRDHLSLSTHWDDGEFLHIGAHSRQVVRVAARQSETWRQLAWHLAAGWRLRSRFTPEEAVLTPEGRVIHSEGAARSLGARQRLRAAVVRIDRARTRSARRSAGSLELWQGLVDGRWSLVDHFETDGRRYVVAHANPPKPSGPAPSDRSRARLCDARRSRPQQR